ncbi:MAG TPA: isoprenylcysteine carboxylmethyltransferase family protein [Gammaproteobacteria bacterium]|nr:isoprenylcysteine carboxylmethyltransferase family protein [Gammaproteobacteria bacterium]
MFSYQLPDSGVNFANAGICSIIIISVFIRMSFAYTQKRAHKQYSRGKQPAPSIPAFSRLSKALFVSSMLVCLMSYWFSSIVFLQIKPSPAIQLLGASCVLYGSIRLECAFSSLGNNYSPLFEAYMPFQLITQGAYRRIRHPVYLYNLFVSFGLAISSGSALVAINAGIGLVFVLKAIRLEEVYLVEHFSEYSDYQKHSWRLIPYVY